MRDYPSIGMPQTNSISTWISDNLQRYQNLQDEDIGKAFSRLAHMYAMRREGSDQSYTPSFIQWMESTFQPTQETEIPLYNFFPSESPRIMNSEI
ncbi:hypothetical protein MPTK1_5g00150 [Marchantia polymorpha subsp. ruderalis]|uniref:Uncharacterized protein n=2 Tax=Marchantia polymorpha TaxID=3197 RepID=A0AAF6BDC2_MARPO|nr:hypothetical protein MARPO_0078s0016 [Marchantia polymorpha]BBN10006.1 hypothetical protein Mp_5g00150 [Marchantia polymorpha subsp. ruderalis]|eukprot:PTQ34600.1 hypothetical protein MARPO_0078s0016 [Marchantia polymorpha]